MYGQTDNGLDTPLGLAGGLLGAFSDRERRKAEEAAAKAAEARAQEAIVKASGPASAPSPWWKTRPALIAGGIGLVILVSVILLRRKAK